MNNHETTLGEVMEFLQENIATKEELKVEMNQLKQDLLDAMDDKLADLKGDIVVLTRKGDHKVVSLITLLKSKMLITEEEANNLLTMEPFPRLVV